MVGTASVTGGLWGDEGKGKIVDYLVARYLYNVRFQGGPNAGHTVIIGKDKTVLHQIPSGIMHSGKKCVIGNGCVVNPDVTLSEMTMLRSKGVPVGPSNLFISPLAPAILPYHILEDAITEISQKIGTTLQGIGPAYCDHYKRTGLNLMDLTDLSKSELEDKVEARMNAVLALAKSQKVTREIFLEWLNDKKHPSRQKMLARYMENYFPRRGLIDKRKVIDAAVENGARLKDYMADVKTMLNDADRKEEGILFEGAQGARLDGWFGSWPYVTSSFTTTMGIGIGTGFAGPIDDKYLIFKAFATRVGEGAFPTEMGECEERTLLGDDGTEVGATTGRPRRIGWFDVVLAKHAAMENGMYYPSPEGRNSIVITKLDRLDSLREIKICVGYEYKGQRLEHIIPTASVLSECKPIYETLPGWVASTKGITDYDNLPTNAKKYIERLENLLGCDVGIIGTGRERNQLIVRAA